MKGNEEMKKIIFSIIFVLNLLILIGCDIESILDDNSMQSENVENEENENNENEDNESEITDNLNNQFKFDNYESLTYSVEEYDLLDESSVRIIKANYMPELSTVCINVEIIDQNYRYYSYIARLGPKSGSQSGARDKIFEINSSQDSINLCFNDLTKGENYIHIAKSLPYNADIMLTFSFTDQQFSSRSKLTDFNIYNKTERSVEIGTDPNLMIDFRVTGDKEAIGKLVLKVFDPITTDEIHKKEFTKDDVVFNGDVGYISDYKIEGLAHNYEYHVAMLYYPPSDLDDPILIDTADIRSTSINGVNNICFYHYLYSYIYNIEYYGDSTTFTTFIKNDDNFINESTGRPHKLNFNVYSPEGALLYTTTVVDGQEIVVIPNEYLFIDGYVTIEIESTNKELSRKVLKVDN